MNTPCRVKPDESTPVIGIMPASEVEQIIKAKDTELSTLCARCERAEAELSTIREMVSPLDGQTLIEAIDYLLHDDSSGEVYRVDLATVTAERDALRDNVICRFCGASYPIGAEQPDHWRTCKASPIAAMINDLEAQLRTYQRREALRQ